MRADWPAVAYTATQWGAPLLCSASEHAKGEDSEDVVELDDLVLGARPPAAALLDLAKAAQLAPPGSPIHDAVQELSAALIKQVKALAPLPT